MFSVCFPATPCPFVVRIGNKYQRAFFYWDSNRFISIEIVSMSIVCPKLWCIQTFKILRPKTEADEQ